MCKRLKSLALLTLLVSLGCDGGGTTDATPAVAREQQAEAAGRVTATAAGSAVRITNGTSKPIIYNAMLKDLQTLALWAPCTDPAKCPPVESGRTVSVPYEAIIGYTPGSTTATIFWWHLSPDGSGRFRAETVQSVDVSL